MFALTILTQFVIKIKNQNQKINQAAHRFLNKIQKWFFGVKMILFFL